MRRTGRLAALAQILLWAAAAFTPIGEIPPAIQLAVTTVLVFLLGYVTPPASRDQIVVAPLPEATS